KSADNTEVTEKGGADPTDSRNQNPVPANESDKQFNSGDSHSEKSTAANNPANSVAVKTDESARQGQIEKDAHADGDSAANGVNSPSAANSSQKQPGSSSGEKQRTADANVSEQTTTSGSRVPFPNRSVALDFLTNDYGAVAIGPRVQLDRFQLVAF